MTPFYVLQNSVSSFHWKHVKTKYEITECVIGSSVLLILLRLQLVLTALNSSKSAYASFSFDKTTFFERYNFNIPQIRSQQSHEDGEARFTCQLYNKVRYSGFLNFLVQR